MCADVWGHEARNEMILLQISSHCLHTLGYQWLIEESTNVYCGSCRGAGKYK